MTVIYHQAFIGLGSNLEEPSQQISTAISELEQLSQCKNLTCSHWYQSKAIGPEGQPDYINAAVRLETSLDPQALLQQLQTIENNHGRQRTIRWGARTLDLDLLLYGDRQIDEPNLTIPHPEIMNRDFVLYPLYDLAPELELPNGQKISSLIEKMTATDLQRLSERS